MKSFYRQALSITLLLSVAPMVAMDDKVDTPQEEKTQSEQPAGYFSGVWDYVPSRESVKNGAAIVGSTAWAATDPLILAQWTAQAGNAGYNRMPARETVSNTVLYYTDPKNLIVDGSGAVVGGAKKVAGFMPTFRAAQQPVPEEQPVPAPVPAPQPVPVQPAQEQREERVTDVTDVFSDITQLLDSITDEALTNNESLAGQYTWLTKFTTNNSELNSAAGELRLSLLQYNSSLLTEYGLKEFKNQVRENRNAVRTLIETNK